jgi:hypothetical protein
MNESGQTKLWRYPLPPEVSIAVRGSQAVKLQRVLPDSTGKTPRIWGHSAFSKSP